jgi:hypothetical protein
MKIEGSLPINKDNFRFPEFIYLVPIKEPMVHNKYEGLSLQEIENRFGKKEAQIVFDYAALGLGNLTKIEIPFSSPKVEKYVDWEYIESSFKDWKFILKSNRYTQAKEDFIVIEGEMSSFGKEDRKQLLKDIFNWLGIG